MCFCTYFYFYNRSSIIMWNDKSTGDLSCQRKEDVVGSLMETLCPAETFVSACKRTQHIATWKVKPKIWQCRGKGIQVQKLQRKCNICFTDRISYNLYFSITVNSSLLSHENCTVISLIMFEKVSERNVFPEVLKMMSYAPRTYVPSYRHWLSVLLNKCLVPRI